MKKYIPYVFLFIFLIILGMIFVENKIIPIQLFASLVVIALFFIVIIIINSQGVIMKSVRYEDNEFNELYDKLTNEVGEEFEKQRNKLKTGLLVINLGAIILFTGSILLNYVAVTIITLIGWLIRKLYNNESKRKIY